MFKEKEEALQPYLQVFEGSKIKYNSLEKIGKDKTKNNVVKTDLSLWFQVDKEIQGDFLVRSKHFHKNNKRVAIMRTMLHTGFVFGNVVRLLKVFVFLIYCYN